MVRYFGFISRFQVILYSRRQEKRILSPSNSLSIFHQLINNLFSRAAKPGFRLGWRWNELKHISTGAGAEFSHPFLFGVWHDRPETQRSKYQPLLHLNFQTWCYKSSLYTANKQSKFIGRLSNFTNPFIFPCDDQVSNVARRFVLISG